MPDFRLDHVHVIRPERLKTAEFYEKVLGARRIRVLELAGGRAAVDLDLKGSVIRIMQPRAKPLVGGLLPSGHGLEHFGLRTDNLEAAVAGLKAQGVKFVQEITDLGGGTKISFFLAPDGVLVELLETKG